MRCAEPAVPSESLFLPPPPGATSQPTGVSVPPPLIPTGSAHLAAPAQTHAVRFGRARRYLRHQKASGLRLLCGRFQKGAWKRSQGCSGSNGCRHVGLGHMLPEQKVPESFSGTSLSLLEIAGTQLLCRGRGGVHLRRNSNSSISISSILLSTTNF